MNKKIILTALVFCIFLPFVVAHGDEGDSAIFEGLFFVISFGSIGLGLYAAQIERSKRKSNILEMSAAFFAGYYLLNFFLGLVIG